MIKKIFILFCSLLLLNSVLADGWGDINTGNNSSTQENTHTGQIEDSQGEVYAPGDYGAAETKYTMNFYIAVGIGTLAILLVLYMIYLFIKGPSVKWKRPQTIKQ